MMNFSDRASVGATKQTKEGYLIATSRVARTGVQDYLARELGDVAVSIGKSGNDVVRVYRHADEVFSKAALDSLTRVPVTLNHPSEVVTADNWKDLAVGEVGDSYAKDGEWIVVNPMIKDAAALAAARTTHREISMGYTANLVVARDGVDADLEMVDISFNHLALVPRGRAGSQARIGDAANWGASPVTVEDKSMTDLKVVVLGDKQVSVKAEDAATVAAILADHKTVTDAKDTTIGELTAKLADAEAKILTDAQIKELVDAKVKADTMRAAVAAKFGDEAVKDASDAMIEGMHRVLDKAPAQPGNVAKALKDGALEVTDSATRIKAAQAKFLNPEAK